jgi:hypothetical protein
MMMLSAQFTLPPAPWASSKAVSPPNKTFQKNAAPTCYDSTSLNLRSAIKELLTLSTTSPQQQCTPSGVINNSTLVEYRFTATLSGAKGGVTAPPNCTTTGSLNAYGVGTLPYVCRYLASNVSVDHTLWAFGGEGHRAVPPPRLAVSTAGQASRARATNRSVAVFRGPFCLALMWPAMPR